MNIWDDFCERVLLSKVNSVDNVLSLMFQPWLIFPVTFVDFIFFWQYNRKNSQRWYRFVSRHMYCKHNCVIVFCDSSIIYQFFLNQLVKHKKKFFCSLCNSEESKDTELTNLPPEHTGKYLNSKQRYAHCNSLVQYVFLWFPPKENSLNQI